MHPIAKTGARIAVYLVCERGGLCGSCYAFATVDLVSTNYCLRTGSWWSEELRSTQQIVDCGSSDPDYGFYMSGCGGGFREGALMYLQKKQKLALERHYPYRAQEGSCNKSVSSYSIGINNDGTGYVSLDSEDEFKQHIGQHGPVAAGIHVSRNFHSYNSGIFEDTRACLGKRKNHAVLVVGYGRAGNQDYWLIKNSYGPDWGENGYIRMVRGKHMCNIGESGIGLIPKSSDGS